ncbi:hypothetical protein LXL04_028745 [Taraxacum kok-saghyz]
MSGMEMFMIKRRIEYPQFMELLRIQISAANLLFSSPSSLLVFTISPAAHPPLDVASSSRRLLLQIVACCNRCYKGRRLLQIDAGYMISGFLKSKFVSHGMAEGIFRINAEKSKEEEVRDQLNRGNVPEDIEVHYLAGLIKGWFRELPCGVLDGLSPEEVLECNTEEVCCEVVKQLKPTETALMNWDVDLMADVVEQEEFNKINARNISLVFAPNMTQIKTSQQIVVEDE